MKIGLVVEGGGMKCAYSAGILDKFLDDHISLTTVSAYLRVQQTRCPILQDNVEEISVFIRNI